MRIWITLALLAAVSVGTAISANAYMRCTTSCFAGQCTTVCN